LTDVSFSRFSAVLKIDPCHGAVADPLAIVALREELKAMGSAAIHVVPDDSFDDWVVRSDNGEVLLLRHQRRGRAGCPGNRAKVWRQARRSPSRCKNEPQAF
jgi:hypothetical protein